MTNKLCYNKKMSTDSKVVQAFRIWDYLHLVIPGLLGLALVGVGLWYVVNGQSRTLTPTDPGPNRLAASATVTDVTCKSESSTTCQVALTYTLGGVSYSYLGPALTAQGAEDNTTPYPYTQGQTLTVFVDKTPEHKVVGFATPISINPWYILGAGALLLIIVYALAKLVSTSTTGAVLFGLWAN